MIGPGGAYATTRKKGGIVDTQDMNSTTSAQKHISRMVVQCNGPKTTNNNAFRGMGCAARAVRYKGYGLRGEELRDGLCDY